MSARNNVFLIHAETFQRDIVGLLDERGIDVSVLTTRGAGAFEAYQKVLQSTSVHLFSTDARSGVVPQELEEKLLPASASDLELLAPYAAPAIQMLDKNNHDGFAVAQLQALYVRLVSVWSHLLAEHRPSAILYFSGVPQVGFDWILYHLARARGIKNLSLRHTHVEDRTMVCEDIFDIPGPTAEQLAEVADARYDSASPTNDAINRAVNDLRRIRMKLSVPGVLRPLIGKRMIGRESSSPEVLYRPRPTHMQMRVLNVRGRKFARESLAQYDAIARSPDLDAPFVYFPLQVQPEESTLPMGGVFSDQLHVLDIVRRALPGGWRIVVKEHPNQFNKKYYIAKGRTRLFYEGLARMPNVDSHR